MFTQAFSAASTQYKRHIRWQANTNLQPRSGSLLVSYTRVIYLGLVALILAVMSVASMGTAAKVLDLPLSYLPGSPLPKDTMCYTPGDEHVPRCSVHFMDHDIYFNYDAETKIISRTVIPAQDYTLGMLIAAWGTPSGSTLDQYQGSIHWNMRSALLYAHSISPDSRVNFIVYDLTPQPSMAWQGFRSSMELR